MNYAICNGLCMVYVHAHQLSSSMGFVAIYLPFCSPVGNADSNGASAHVLDLIEMWRTKSHWYR